MTRRHRLSDAVTARNAGPIASALRKYGYGGSCVPGDIARWLRAQGEHLDTLVPWPKTAVRELRPSQAAFRRTLLAAYAGRCALTECDVAEVLTAAHVADWRSENDAGAGLLLRADLHALLDCGLLVIDERYTVVRAPPFYAGLVGRRLRLPANRLDWPRLTRSGAGTGSSD